MSDSGHCEGGSERTAPNACEGYDGDEDCQSSDCEGPADWRVEYHAGGNGYFCHFACDEHVRAYWGYHPEENQSQETGGGRNVE